MECLLKHLLGCSFWCRVETCNELIYVIFPKIIHPIYQDIMISAGYIIYYRTTPWKQNVNWTYPVGIYRVVFFSIRICSLIPICNAHAGTHTYRAHARAHTHTHAESTRAHTHIHLSFVLKLILFPLKPSAHYQHRLVNINFILKKKYCNNKIRYDMCIQVYIPKYYDFCWLYYILRNSTQSVNSTYPVGIYRVVFYSIRIFSLYPKSENKGFFRCWLDMQQLDHCKKHWKCF